MSKEYRWLAREIDRWVAEGVITADQGARIRARYQPAAGSGESFSWGLVVFFALGAVIVGLGVILLLAYNWSGIPKLGKLALIFGGVVAAHVSGIRLRGHTDWRRVLGEGTMILGTMLFGAGIWLVAQVYNIDEHFPTGFLVWGLGALALAWAMPSVAQAILATLALAIWGTLEVVEFGNAVDWASVILVTGIGTLAWRLRSAVLAGVLAAACCLQILSHATHWGGAGTAFASAVALSCGFVAAGEWARDRGETRRIAAVLRAYGLGGFLVCAYILSFADVADELMRDSLRHRESAGSAALYRWSLFALGLAAWVPVFVRAAARRARRRVLEYAFFPLGLVSLMAARGLESAVLVALAFNLVLLGLAGLMIVRGCREGGLRTVVLGSVVLGLLVFGRYFDLFDSLAARGLAFVLFGGALFAEGFYYRKLRQSGADPLEETR